MPVGRREMSERPLTRRERLITLRKKPRRGFYRTQPTHACCVLIDGYGSGSSVVGAAHSSLNLTQWERNSATARRLLPVRSRTKSSKIVEQRSAHVNAF